MTKQGRVGLFCAVVYATWMLSPTESRGNRPSHHLKSFKKEAHLEYDWVRTTDIRGQKTGQYKLPTIALQRICSMAEEAIAHKKKMEEYCNNHGLRCNVDARVMFTGHVDSQPRGCWFVQFTERQKEILREWNQNELVVHRSGRIRVCGNPKLGLFRALEAANNPCYVALKQAGFKFVLKRTIEHQHKGGQYRGVSVLASVEVKVTDDYGNIVAYDTDGREKQLHTVKKQENPDFFKRSNDWLKEHKELLTFAGYVTVSLIILLCLLFRIPFKRIASWIFRIVG